MDFSFFSNLLHFDRYLETLSGQPGVFVYLLLFLIVFFETGVVFAPFLPGDSLIFVAGTLAARGYLDVITLFFVFFTAAILGDSVNYWIGNTFGTKFYERSRFYRPQHLRRAQLFYETYGAKTIVLSRFIPIVRTFAPFVAGVAKMEYFTFFVYNVLGGFIWVALLTFAGFYFGTIPFVQQNLELIVIGIVVISLLPVLWEYVRAKRMH